MKNYKKVFRNILIICSIILIVFIANTIRKAVILQNCSKEKNWTNYYAKEVTYERFRMIIKEKFYKDGKGIITYKNSNNNDSFIMFTDKTTNQGVLLSGDNKIIRKYDDINQTPFINIVLRARSFIGVDFWSNIMNACMTKITTEKCNGKECYLIQGYQGIKIWIDKENYLPVREIGDISYNDGEVNVVTDYIFEKDIVTDEQVKNPEE